MPKPKYPICRACPNCGSARAQKVKSSQTVSFSGDRICTQCRTRYVPPTPVWGSVVFLAFGLLLAGVCVPATLLMMLRLYESSSQNSGSSGSGTSMTYSMICSFVPAVIGMLSMIHGFRSILEKPVEPPEVAPPEGELPEAAPPEAERPEEAISPPYGDQLGE